MFEGPVGKYAGLAWVVLAGDQPHYLDQINGAGYKIVESGSTIREMECETSLNGGIAET